MNYKYWNLKVELTQFGPQIFDGRKLLRNGLWLCFPNLQDVHDKVDNLDVVQGVEAYQG